MPVNIQKAKNCKGGILWKEKSHLHNMAAAKWGSI